MSASISTSAPTEGKIKTRFLVLSDTHALDHRQLPGTVLHRYAGVVLHCGDLTNDSTIEEYESSIRLLQALNAPLKLVIAGNHDFTLDGPVFSKRLAETRPRLDDKLVKKIYGSFGDVKRLFKQAGITFLDEGNHSIKLQNGASLNIYASPYTPSCYRGWGFQYHPNFVHKFLCTSARTRTEESSAQKIDIIMTHGPPQGILDKTDSGVRGCPYLFKATARARPLMHCFGHIHEGWGAKLVTWRQPISTEPSHLTDIIKKKSLLIEDLSTIKEERSLGISRKYCTTSHSSSDLLPLSRGAQTLFVNAAFKGTSGSRIQPPWFVDLDLSPA